MAKDDSTELDPFLAALGRRVYAARRTAKMTRRSLAKSTGMSERYLAQIELGTGNVSVGRLNGVANALGMTLSQLVEDEDPLVTALRTAGPMERARVMTALGGDRDHGGRIALIGLRGAGKSTLGTLLAQRLSIPFCELNDLIAEEAGMSVEEVFALYGQEGYRELEQSALDRLAAEPAIVLAVSGGIVSEPETFARLLLSFRTIWLRARPEEHMSRVREQGDERPMAGNPTAMKELRTILTARETHYARADHVIETSGRTVLQSVSDLMELLSPAKGGNVAAE
ncbi:MAG: helix-turn-helix transcriptional regulator [Pseudomonadota bacterium]